MPHVTFYLQEQLPASDADPLLVSACHLVANCYSNKQYCSVMCDNQAQAEALDELLWQLPAGRFVPHNLQGEGPANGTPVEICWQAPQRFNKGVLVNLASAMPEFAHKFKRVYDFVPADDAAKQLARERYKHYRAAGCQLVTLPASQINES